MQSVDIVCVKNLECDGECVWEEICRTTTLGSL